MMTRDEALKWLAGIFEEDPAGIAPETPREDIPTWDSLGVLTLMAELDQKCGILLTEQELKSMARIDDILQVMNARGKLAA